jgi:hypothetical protein
LPFLAIPSLELDTQDDPGLWPQCGAAGLRVDLPALQKSAKYKGNLMVTELKQTAICG